MAFNPSQLANLTFKKVATGKASSSDSKPFFEEPKSGRSFVAQNQIWTDSNMIPLVAPSGSAGVVARIENLLLENIPGASASFANPSLKDVVPFNWGDGTSYNYVLKDSFDNPIPFGKNDWYLDPETGVLTFFNGIPANTPPKISCWKYVGRKGIATDVVTSVNGATGAVEAVNNLNGMKGNVTLRSGRYVTLTHNASAGEIEIDVTNLVASVNGGQGDIQVLPGPNVQVITTPSASGATIVIGMSGSPGLDTHRHNGVDSPRINWNDLLNRPLMVTRLNGLDGALQLLAENGLYIVPDLATKTLTLGASGLATYQQLATHTHDGVNSPPISFTRLANVPKLINSINGASGSVFLVGGNEHVQVRASSGNPGTFEIFVTGFAEANHTHGDGMPASGGEDFYAPIAHAHEGVYAPVNHEHEYVTALNGLKGDVHVIAASGGGLMVTETENGVEIGLHPEGIPQLSPHAAEHRPGGSDPLAPGDIGAAPAIHTHGIDDLPENLVRTINGFNKEIVLKNGHGVSISATSSGDVTTLTFEMTASAGKHAGQHKLGGTDPITPGDIGAAPAFHTHDGRYASLTHNHDQDYADAAHDHDDRYAEKGHTHADSFAATDHRHDTDYASLGHNHDARYAATSHSHAGQYASSGHGHNYVTLLNGATGRTLLKAGSNVSITTTSSPLPEYDFIITINASGSGGGGGTGGGEGGGGAAQARAWTNEYVAAANQSEFQLDKTLDLDNPIKLTVANVRQPRANFSYDSTANKIILNGWSTLAGDLVFIDYFYL